MSGTRTGYYSELNRREVYLQILADKNKLDEDYKLIVTHIANYGPSTFQELGDAIGKPTSEISARINELVKLDVISTIPDSYRDKKTGKLVEGIKKKINPLTHKPNTIWALKEEQIPLF